MLGKLIHLILTADCFHFLKYSSQNRVQDQGMESNTFCPMPFLYDGVHFDYCTKKKIDGEGYEDFYWCPQPSFLDDKNTFSVEEGDERGKCTEHLYPPGKTFNFVIVNCYVTNKTIDNGCPENYMPIANKYCIRASAYPEKFAQAQQKCNSEGAYLLQYTNEEIHVSRTQVSAIQQSSNKNYILARGSICNQNIEEDQTKI